MENAAAVPDVRSELVRRHNATSRTVLAMLVGVVLLGGIAYLSKKFLTQHSNPSLDMAVRISILILGLSSIALRRTKFSAMRLQDIGSLGGPVCLLATLQKTTIHVALLACLIALIGFAGTLFTGNDFYAYAVRHAWEAAVRRFAASENLPDSPAKSA